MDLRFVAPELRELDRANAEVLACSIWSDERPVRGVAGMLDWRFAGKLSALMKRGYATGELGEVLMVPGKPGVAFEKILVFGAGARGAFGEQTFRAIVTRLLRTLEGLGVRRAVVELPGRPTGAIDAALSAQIVRECAGDAPHHDAWWLVEDADGERQMRQRAKDDRRRAARE
jgi:Cytosol aminopeptidase family, N-terminal domain